MVGQGIFYLLAALTVGSALIVAFSQNIVYSTFALLGAFMGVVGVYVLLAADFVAMVQLLVYVGGILVLTIFAVMLTAGISDVTISNRAVGATAAILVSLIACGVMFYAILKTPWRQEPLVNAAATPTTYGIGNAFLGAYTLPFEIASVVLLAALIGAIVISRHEVRD
jgi:NADH-quinone oxidoreductase subunit J